METDERTTEQDDELLNTRARVRVPLGAGRARPRTGARERVAAARASTRCSARARAGVCTTRAAASSICEAESGALGGLGPAPYAPRGARARPRARRRRRTRRAAPRGRRPASWRRDRQGAGGPRAPRRRLATSTLTLASSSSKRSASSNGPISARFSPCRADHVLRDPLHVLGRDRVEPGEDLLRLDRLRPRAPRGAART